MVLVAKAKPHTTISHKKRSGGHHRHSKDYIRPYVPYLPMILIVLIGLFVNTSLAHANTDVLGFSTDVSVTNLLADTNAQRIGGKDKALVLDSQLMVAAQDKANDMVSRNYWSHNTPDGKTPWTFMQAAGYKYQAAGENLAYGFNTSASALNGWMNSPEHRANILNRDYSQVGFGIVNAPNYRGDGPETVIVAMYGEPIKGTDSSAVNAAKVLGDNTTSPTSNKHSASQRIARIESWSGGSTQAFFVVSVLAAGAAVWLILRHSLAWRRVLVRSERFVVRHRMLDILMVVTVTLGFILTRSAGFIH